MTSVKAKGIDVSKYQTNVDYKKVKAAGYDFVIIRAGYGKIISQKDSQFETHYKTAKAAGMHIGAYWYSYATDAETAKTEARICLQVIQGKTFEYPIFFDLEESAAFEKGKNVCSEIVTAFCGVLEAAGYFTGLYISRLPLQVYITDAVAKRYALWIAEYNTKCNYSGSYGIWQHSNTGSINGISGNVDCNYCYIDYPNIIKKGGLNGFSKSSTPVGATVKYSKGAKITLKNTTLYASSTAISGSKKSGTYYVYDGIMSNGRLRITNSVANVGKTPIGSYVTGWVDLSEMR